MCVMFAFLYENWHGVSMRLCSHVCITVRIQAQSAHAVMQPLVLIPSRGAHAVMQHVRIHIRTKRHATKKTEMNNRKNTKEHNKAY